MRAMNGLAVFVLCLLFAWVGHGRDLYVATNGVGGGSPVFGTWLNASSNIEWAVNAASTGDRVLISNGVYVLSNTITVASKDITIAGTGGVTVVDGNYSNRCLYFYPNANCILENLTFAHGSNGGGVKIRSYGTFTIRDCVFSNNYSSDYGGGLNISQYQNGTTTVQRCTFVNNNAKFAGGGLALFSCAGGLVEQCLFLTNTAADGGGLYYGAGSSNMPVTACDFISNVATNDGGGVYWYGNTAADQRELSYCTLSSNVSGRYGGAGWISSGTMMVSNCWVSNNVAVDSGGGFYGGCGRGIWNCIIARNTTTLAAVANYRGGGGANLVNCVVQNCIIEENNTARSGGGLFVHKTTLVNCLIRNNVAIISAGGIEVRSGNIRSCTIVSNYAGTGGGGGIKGNYLTNDGGGFFENCVIYSNQCAHASTYYNFVLNGGAGYDLYKLTNCCFTPALVNAGNLFATNTVTASPQFENPTGGNYRLTRYSPCINAGINRNLATVDLDGHARLDHFSGLVDIGCYEFIPTGFMLFGK